MLCGTQKDLEVQLLNVTFRHRIIGSRRVVPKYGFVAAHYRSKEKHLQKSVIVVAM